MFEPQTPLEVVAALSESNSLDIDTNQVNRYCIRLNTAKGKEAYYFGTPIYNITSRKSVNRRFTFINGCYKFIGSSCEVLITATQLKMVRGKEEYLLNFGKAHSWSLKDGALVCEHFLIIPTYNGVCIEGKMDQLKFDTAIKFPYQRVRKSQSCVCFMESRFKPVLVISALYAQKQNGGCQPMQVQYNETSKNNGTLCFGSEAPIYHRGIFEIDFYEPKLIQDTPVSGKYPKENNAFGPIAFIGKSSFYGTQWLYSRLELNKLPEQQNQYIREMKLYIPRFTNESTQLNVFDLSNRFCSFGSNWSNKVQKGDQMNAVDIKGEYLCVDLTRFYTNRGRLTAGAGIVFVPTHASELGYQAISTGDSYTMPPILCVKYDNQ